MIDLEKPNSLQMMEKFNKALEDINNINENLESIKKKINTKINIINTINKYTTEYEKRLNMTSRALSLSDGHKRIIFGLNNDSIVDGNYDSYGQVIHAPYTSMSTNVFNILTESGPIFKDNVKVEIFPTEDLDDENWKKANDAYQYEYCNILKHESDPTKEDVFKVFSSNKITLSITVNVGNIINGTTFDTIEFCPYMPGSFSIDEIHIFTMQQYLSQNMLIPEYVENSLGNNTLDMQNIGNVRITLDKSYQLYKIDFLIDLHKMDDSSGYPFGLRHLYFLNTSQNISASYVVVKVDCDYLISHIEEDIQLYMADGQVLSTRMSEYGIKCYGFYSNKTLDDPIEFGDEISRNISTFYARIPLKKPIIGIEFNNIARSN